MDCQSRQLFSFAFWFLIKKPPFFLEKYFWVSLTAIVIYFLQMILHLFLPGTSLGCGKSYSISLTYLMTWDYLGWYRLCNLKPLILWGPACNYDLHVEICLLDSTHVLVPGEVSLLFLGNGLPSRFTSALHLQWVYSSCDFSFIMGYLLLEPPFGGH